MKTQLVGIKDNENLGKYYFKKGIDFVTKKEFGKAYEFLKEGLGYFTCDCEFQNWHEKYKVSLAKIFFDIENSNVNHSEYFFTKALLLSYTQDKKWLYVALESIEKYEETAVDEYTFYIKGKIYYNLDLYEKAYECVIKATSFSNNHRLNYRIGRLKEEYLKQNGTSFIFLSFSENPSSGCCAKELKRVYQNYNLNLQIIEEYIDNELIKEFTNNKSSVLFRFTYEKAFAEQIKNPKSIKLINDFISFIEFNSSSFIPEIIDEDDLDDDYDYSDDYSDDSPSSYDSPYYNDALDMDQQSPEFWDSI